MASISAMAPLRAPLFRWYFASRSINLIGSMMAPVALAFAVIAVSRSPIALGLVLAARTIPLIVFMLLGGVVADRWGRAPVIAASNLASGASQAVAAVLVLTGHAELWQLVLLSAINGTASAAGIPALSGLVPQLVPPSQLQEADALTSLTRAVLAILGPSLAAVFVVGAGPGWALLIDAATWLVAAALMLRVRVPSSPVPTTRSIIGDLATGWGYFRKTTWLWLGVAATCLLNALYEGGFNTLGPVRAERSDLGAHGWGLALSAQGIGVLLATLALMRWRLHRPLFLGMLGMALFGLPMVVLGTTTELAVLLLAALLSGVGIQVFSMGWTLAMQENIPGSLLSRASSYDQLGSYAAIPIGQLCLGPLAAAYGLGNVLLVSGIVYIAVSLLLLLSSSIRGLGRALPEPHTQAA
ncbi:MFS transporter [Nocardioides sp. DS6]|uniref:MFS transporter n=1 Tax=Nocardioides eburneus TaxID=3231482 RepID=A0ABV3SZ63_9ACTN